MWQKLKAHYSQFTQTLNELFEQDSDRHHHFSEKIEGLHYDYAKTHLNKDTFTLLIDLAKEANIEQKRAHMFSGKPINHTENRAALHTALRAGDKAPEAIKHTLHKMEHLIESVYSGSWTGYSGKIISDIVNIGIGGSDLGPRLVVEALKPYHHKKVNCHFVANVDASDLLDTLENLNPETTLFLVASKSFTTQETLMNALSAKEWLLQHTQDESATAKHFVAMTANIQKAVDFGIEAQHCYAMWDFVGGRYSLWSTIGLPIAFAIGMAQFRELLAGANAMDEHFQTAELEHNIPVISALIGVWYRNFFGCQTYGILPYDQHLNLLPSFLQQLEMESNGKSVLNHGNPSAHHTCGVIWGGAGTNGQHAFFQLLHQGTLMIPSDFIVMREPTHNHKDHHLALYSNAIAQMQGLMQGKNIEQATAELEAAGLSQDSIKALAPHKVIEGNKPTCAIILDKLTPFNLGLLIALYEHKVFTQSCIWDINAFDQWGVELGKQLAKPISQALDKHHTLPVDGSTQAMMNLFKGE